MATFQGLADNERSSSRVLKPPGGGHSNIFGPADSKPTHARPKYDQQNSSNICGALGTADANDVAEATARVIEEKHGGNTTSAPGAANSSSSAAGATEQASAPAAGAPTGRGRVPPGGHSSGFW